MCATYLNVLSILRMLDSMMHRYLEKLRVSYTSNEKFQKSEITMELGGWVHVSLGIFFLEDRPKIALNQY